MAQLLFAACVLAVVIVGVLMMIQILSLEQLGAGIWRGFLLVVITFMAVWFLKLFLLPMLVFVLVWLKCVALWALLCLLAAIALMFVVAVYFKTASRSKSSTNKQ